jgi:iron complex transport system substrate-binding protein
VQRIVSLLPSTTETVFALGAGHRLVGRSHECDLPAAASAVPVLTAPRIDVDAPSATIDRKVRTLVKRALSIYTVDAERLRELRPDVILTQTQCEVCAVTPRDLEGALREWVGAQPVVVSVEPARLDDIFGDIERIGEAIDVCNDGRALAAELRVRLARLSVRTGALPHCPRVACIEWIEPLMGAGNWIPELVGWAAGESLFGRAGEHSSWIEFEQLLGADPDVILLLPCGFTIERTRRELGPLVERPSWRDLRAVREGRVYLLDGSRHFNRPGPRILESQEILLEVLYPDRFGFGHEGVGWEPL